MLSTKSEKGFGVVTLTRFPAMAKTPRKGNHASTLRWGDWSPKDLRAAADTLKNLAGFFEGLATQMEQLGSKSLRVDGDKKYSAATDLLTEFGGNVQKAIINFQTRRN
jgi:hypothetical protein